MLSKYELNEIIDNIHGINDPNNNRKLMEDMNIKIRILYNNIYVTQIEFSNIISNSNKESNKVKIFSDELRGRNKCTKENILRWLYNNK